MPARLTLPARRDKMVETMMTADSLRLTAYGQEENQIRVAEGAANGRRLAACGLGRMRGRNTPEPLVVSRKPMARPDALAYELYGLTEVEIRMMEAS